MIIGETNMFLLKAQLKKVCWYSSLVNVGAMFFGIIWSMIYQWEESTATHCNVPNYLPSMSAAIGYTPQAYVWRSGITTTCAIRYVFANSYWKWYSLRPLKKEYAYSNLRDILAPIALFSHYVEIFGLLLLTVVSSRENKDVHEAGFVIFIVGALIYMATTVAITSMVRLDTPSMVRAAKLKKIAAALNYFLFASAMYFYKRHNDYCEPGVYTMFSLCEYLVVITNIIFHNAITIDLEDFSIVLCDNEGEVKMR